MEINSAYEFAKLVRVAHLRAEPVRFILLDGERVFGELAVTASSKVRARLLDTAPWFVHDCDIEKAGNYKLVRNSPAPNKPVISPYDAMVDPGLDPEFQQLIAGLDATEREVLIKARVGQGGFRERLVTRWEGCSLTRCGFSAMLVASHIKPWSRCETSEERLGASNGLLLTPNLDKAFDRGLISFDDKFKLMISPELAQGHQIQLGIPTGSTLNHAGVGPDLLPYLQWHRDNIFRSGA